MGYTLDKKPIPQIYKGGRVPRSSHPHIGQVDLLGALETSSNPYFALLAGEVLEDPDELSQAARLFSYGQKTGIALPGESAGTVPLDLQTNRTGLYAMAIGQHTLTATPLQTAVMLSALANGGKVVKPKIVLLTAGKEPDRGEAGLFQKDRFSYQKLLALVGVDFPLFTQAEAQDKKNQVTLFADQKLGDVFLPSSVRQTLLEGMRQVIHGARGSARASYIRSYATFPEALREYREWAPFMVGKSGTSEKVERIGLQEDGMKIVHHIWFGSIGFEEAPTHLFEHPEITVVVFLPYGDYGKEAAPLAAQVIKKWREIKARRS